MPLFRRTTSVSSPIPSFRGMVVLLEELGFTAAFTSKGETIIVLSDYPSRPIIDWNQVVYVTPPIGFVTYHSETQQESYAYTMQAPVFVGGGVEAVSDLRPLLARLREFGEQVKAEFSFEADLAAIVPFFYVFGNDNEKIQAALSRSLHPKKASDMLRLGYSFQNVLDYAQIPGSAIYGMAPNPSV